jgi:hypothetical protein
MRTLLAAHAGRLIEDTLVPIGIPVARSTVSLRRRELRVTVEALLASLLPDFTRVAAAHAQARADEITRETAELFSGALARETRIRMSAAGHPAPLVQPGLFDNRAIQEHLKGHARGESIRLESETFVRLVESSAQVYLARTPEVALLILTTLSRR